MTISISGRIHPYPSSKLIWEERDDSGLGDREDTVWVNVAHLESMQQDHFECFLLDKLKRNGVEWLRRAPIGWGWELDADLLKHSFKSLSSLHWLTGRLTLRMHFLQSPARWQSRLMPSSYVFPSYEPGWSTGMFHIYADDVREQMPKRIFLSHKGVDKPMVRRFKNALETVGFEPWLDEEAMAAGTNLERGLLLGFQESCAAVFFVTAHYVDADYLATEIDYAVAEVRKKGEQFKVITLVLMGENGARGQVPPLLAKYVWKTPDSELEAFVEIVRALPLRIEGVKWR